ncbi:NTP transferase domain-containing protein [Desulfurococcaceae archaeon MEX13E-LK6-19]|nr:NTP transferase domain-containing protein [Desulfurococcaceae archaeon MEX13E-LK6-19]
MKAILLVAGKGERLRPITSTRPKPLIPILCKPLIYWHLDALAKTSVDEIIVVASYMKEKIVKAVEEHELSRKITVVDQGRELGTGDAVAKALEAMDSDDDVLIIYGDLFLGDWSIYKDLTSLDGNFVVAVEHNNPRDYGVLIVERGRVKGIVEKPEEPPTNLVNAGIYKFDSRILKKYISSLKPSPRGELEFTDVITNAAREGVDIKVYSIGKTEWIDIGTPWNLLEANKIALNKFLVNEIKGVVEDNVTIKGPVFIGENSVVKQFTSIEGPAYIDRDVVIGPSARIRPYTTICRKSRVGFSVEVKESILLEHVYVNHLSYVGDSIICENVNFGAGTITANLRFDEREVKMTIKGKRVSSGRRKLGAIVGANVRTGINVSLMPGVKIGVNSWIAPGAIVDRDVPDNVFYRVRQEYYIESLPSIKHEEKK